MPPPHDAISEDVEALLEDVLVSHYAITDVVENLALLKGKNDPTFKAQLAACADECIADSSLASSYIEDGQKVFVKLVDNPMEIIAQAEIARSSAEGGKRYAPRVLAVFKDPLIVLPGDIDAANTCVQHPSRASTEPHTAANRPVASASLEVTTFSAKWGMITEFVEGMDLFSVAKHQQLSNGKEVTQAHLEDLMLQCVEAVNHMHNVGWAHHDIKPENIMLTTDNRILLVDFGLARPIMDYTGNDMDVQPTQESASANRRYSASADWPASPPPRRLANTAHRKGSAISATSSMGSLLSTASSQSLAYSRSSTRPSSPDTLATSASSPSQPPAHGQQFGAKRHIAASRASLGSMTAAEGFQTTIQYASPEFITAFRLWRDNVRSARSGGHAKRAGKNSAHPRRRSSLKAAAHFALQPAKGTARRMAKLIRAIPATITRRRSGSSDVSSARRPNTTTAISSSPSSSSSTVHRSASSASTSSDAPFHRMYDYRTDIYSLGLTFAVLTMQRLPFWTFRSKNKLHVLSDEEIYRLEHASFDYRQEHWDSLGPRMDVFIRSFLAVDPADRVALAEAANVLRGSQLLLA